MSAWVNGWLGEWVGEWVVRGMSELGVRCADEWVHGCFYRNNGKWWGGYG